METKISKWFNDRIAIVGVATGVVVWTFTTFLPRHEFDAASKSAHAIHEKLEKSQQDDYQRMNDRINNLEKTMSEVAKDTSYIRGRLEPRGR